MDQIVKNDIRGKIYVLLTALFWSTAGVCTKFIPWSAMSLVCVRGALGALTLFVLYRNVRIHFTLHNVLGALALVATSASFLAANKLTTAANAIVLQYTAPVFILIYTVFVKKKRPTWFESIVIALVLCGCVLAFADKIDGGYLWGNILGLVSGVTFAAMILMNRNPKTNAQECQLLGNLMGFVFFLPFLFFDSSLSFELPTLAAMAFLGICQYGMASFFFSLGIKRVNPVTASVLLTVEPICSPIWVFLCLGELPGPLAIAGFIVVILAVSVYTLLPVVLKRPSLCSTDD